MCEGLINTKSIWGVIFKAKQSSNCHPRLLRSRKTLRHQKGYFCTPRVKKSGLRVHFCTWREKKCCQSTVFTQKGLLEYISGVKKGRKMRISFSENIGEWGQGVQLSLPNCNAPVTAPV